jgi:bacillithiol synthase
VHKTIPFSKTGAFTKLFLDFIDKNIALKPYFGEYPDIEGFKNQLSIKKFEHRSVLVNALKNQYKDIANPPNIDLFTEENTFCVTTGHQLNIFTGPLYVIFKIVTIINLTKKLKSEFPAYNFVPVYWMATEDHDFEEIANFSLFGQTHLWETTQTGAVGRMNPSEILNIIENLKDKPEVFAKAYGNNSTLTAAVRQYMHELFGNQGLISIDGDDHDLKSLFRNIIKDDVISNSNEKLVAHTTSGLEKLGYKSQINARNINFFYLEKSLRERLEKKDENYAVVNSTLVFDKSFIEKLIETEPEKFSPNVVLRPLYQETILPNLAYIGGPSEVCYWMQLKDIFEYHKITFPILMPRNFALIVNGASQKKLDKLGVNVTDLFEEETNLKRNFINNITENTLDFATEQNEINEVFEKITLKANAIDPTLKAAVEVEKTKLINGLENLEKRLKKAEERNFETSINQLLSSKEKLFPGGGLQERKENFLNFYLNDPTFIDKLLAEFDPLDFNFNVINI